MKKVIALCSLFVLTGFVAFAQTKPASLHTKHVATPATKKQVEPASKKAAVLVKKEEKKADEKIVKKEERKPVGHKHAHQAKVVKS